MRIWPLEEISNITQMVVLTGIVVRVLMTAERTKEPEMARFFALGAGITLLGQVFWSIHIVLFGNTPSGISPADIAWIGGYCFLTGFLQIGARGRRRPKWIFLVPMIVACDAGVWISWADGNVGSIMNDVVYAVVLSVMAWFIFIDINDSTGALRPFYFSAAMYLIAEMAMFTSWGIVYSILDFVVTGSMIAMAVTFVRGITSEEVLR